MGAGRRQFLTGLGFAAAGAAVASPAIADPAPDVEWRLTSSFVSSLDLIYGGAETFSKAVLDLTDGHFSIKVAGRFITNEKRGVGNKSARDGNTLLLTA